jgi:hypothetical protein
MWPINTLGRSLTERTSSSFQTVGTTSPDHDFTDLSPEQRSKLIAELAELGPRYAQQPTIVADAS